MLPVWTVLRVEEMTAAAAVTSQPFPGGQRSALEDISFCLDVTLKKLVLAAVMRFQVLYHTAQFTP